MPLPPAVPPTLLGTQASALDIIKSTLRLIGVIAAGENPTPDEAKDALIVLNQMLDACNAERLMIPQITRNQFPLTPSKQTYTLGTGGNFDLARPPKIQFMTLIDLNGLELPWLEIIDEARWATIADKTLQSPYPQRVYDDNGFPFRNLSFWPIPNTNVKTVIYGWQAITQFPNLSQTLSFPPGYFEFLRFNLAPRLAPEYGRQTPPEVAVLAVESKARIKSFNVVPLEIRCGDEYLDPTGQRYSIQTGMFIPR